MMKKITFTDVYLQYNMYDTGNIISTHTKHSAWIVIDVRNLHRYQFFVRSSYDEPKLCT
jgi:hypothetical protein